MRFVKTDGNITKNTRPKTQCASYADIDSRVEEALRRLDARIADVEDRTSPPAIEFDVTCPASGTVTINHGFDGAIRWYVTSWKRKTNPGTYSLSEVTGSTQGTLVLNSKAAGQAVIRVESVQSGQSNRDSSSADTAQNLSGTTIGGSQYDILESDGAGGVSYLTQASGAANKWVKYGATGPTYSTLHSKSQYDVLISDGSNGFSSVTQASGSANKVLTWGSSGPTWGVQAGRWTTVYDLDFTSLNLSTATGNGNFTIDGKTWTVANFAKSSVMSVGGADGLRIKCTTSSSGMAPAINNAPYFISPGLATLLPTLPDDVRVGLRFSIYVKSYNRPTASDSTYFMVCDSTIDATRFEFEQFNNAGTQSDYMRLVLNSSTKVSQTIGAILTSPSTHDCFQWEMGQLGIDIPNIIQTGIYSSGFPSKWYRRAQCSAAAGSYFNTAIKELADAKILFGQGAAGAAGTSEVKFGRLLVEYYLYN